MKTKLVLIAAALTGCLMVSAATAAEKADALPTPAALQAQLRAMSPAAKAECHLDSHGFPACTTNGVETFVTTCTGDMYFGQVSDSAGATLDSEYDKTAGKPRVKLAEGQFLCLAATVGKTSDPSRFYVVAMPTERVKDCKGNDLCQSKPVQWVGGAPKEACTWKGNAGEFTGACPAGWVDADKVEQFSMGLH
ncbi:hypothetical protein L2Y96_07360 [Luteibacter aegosomaticola]|uniref:hypothetical protein n=1 Tax=Luteibacter aegosomaticola TaxID=2911538 RepID=UPI001FFC10A8|nr:hypothetical protein [Luteibacter aegosomaticola]UPG91580.1 hypothetical protein L2Y96_07360 [Luteibacter aegosomaticola]